MGLVIRTDSDSSPALVRSSDSPKNPCLSVVRAANGFTFSLVAVDDETWQRENWQHEWEESNNETRQAWGKLRDANDKILTLEEQLERFQAKADEENKKLKNKYLEMVKKRDNQIVRLQRHLEEGLNFFDDLFA